ncbi:glycosyltransferase [Pseudomonas silvicola]|nr:glycosyltransferase [Pseudomonas silvicola]
MSVKVLQVSKEFEPLSSGVARHIQGLALALRGQGEVRLAVLAPTVDRRDPPCPLTQGGYASLWRAVGDSDVVHVHGARTPFTAVAAMLARLRGVAVVYTPHCYYDTGTWWRRGLKRLWDLTVERWLVRAAGAVVLLHQGWVVDLARRGLHPGRVLIVPNCIDEHREAFSAPVERLAGSPALLSVGRLDPVKRLDDVILALGTDVLAGAQLHVVGRGDDRLRLEALAEARGLAARVHFHGWQDDLATARMMAGCDAMVLASEREGMPTVVLEALLAGVPILCSDIEGCRAITDAVGWPALFPLAEPEALARCAAAYAGRPVPEAVRDAVRDGFTWSRRAAALAQVYGALLEPRQRPGLGKRLAMLVSDYDNPRSLGARLRARRIGPLLALIRQAHARHGSVNIIDVGGTVRYWNIVPAEFLDAHAVTITLVNLEHPGGPPAHPRFRQVVGDGCDLAGFADQAFHLAHSNSVIEHVGSPRMARFARELERVAEAYFIQTPDFWCPLEPHCMTPIFHWLPRRLRVWLVSRVPLGHWPRAASRDEAETWVDSAQLLSKRRFQALLPRARIIRERVLGMPKSLIAVKP